MGGRRSAAGFWWAHRRSAAHQKLPCFVRSVTHGQVIQPNRFDSGRKQNALPARNILESGRRRQFDVVHRCCELLSCHLSSLFNNTNFWLSHLVFLVDQWCPRFSIQLDLFRAAHSLGFIFHAQPRSWCVKRVSCRDDRNVQCFDVSQKGSASLRIKSLRWWILWLHKVTVQTEEAFEWNSSNVSQTPRQMCALVTSSRREKKAGKAFQSHRSFPVDQRLPPTFMDTSRLWRTPCSPPINPLEIDIKISFNYLFFPTMLFFFFPTCVTQENFPMNVVASSAVPSFTNCVHVKCLPKPCRPIWVG